MVRAGSDLEYWPSFLDLGVVGIHFDWVRGSVDLLLADQSELRAEAARLAPARSVASIRSVAGQTWAFAHEIAVGDLVVTPRSGGGNLSIGRVTGVCQPAPSDVDLLLVRAVEWTRHDVRAQDLGADIQRSLKPRMTVFKPAAPGSVERLKEVADGAADPGPAGYTPDDRVGGWVFQCNPDRYDLISAIDSGWGDDWAMNQQRDRVSVGDRVWFRITGIRAGIYAVGRIISLPYERDLETEGL